MPDRGVDLVSLPLPSVAFGMRVRTKSPSLEHLVTLPAGGLPNQPIPLFVKYEQRVELVGEDFVEADFDAKLQRGTKIQGAADQ